MFGVNRNYLTRACNAGDKLTANNERLFVSQRQGLAALKSREGGGQPGRAADAVHQNISLDISCQLGCLVCTECNVVASQTKLNALLL